MYAEKPQKDIYNFIGKAGGPCDQYSGAVFGIDWQNLTKLHALLIVLAICYFLKLWCQLYNRGSGFVSNSTDN